MSEQIRGGGEWTALREAQLAACLGEARWWRAQLYSRSMGDFYKATATQINIEDRHISDLEQALTDARAALAAAPSEPPATSGMGSGQEKMMNDNQIKYMVNRFLSWRLPENFNPDAGISFKRYFNEHAAHPMKSEPTGTNLFDATQAEEMIRYLVDGMPMAAREVGEPQDFNAKFGGDIYVVTGEHQRTAFFSKAAAERYLAKQDPERFKIIVYAKPVAAREVGEGLREAELVELLRRAMYHEPFQNSEAALGRKPRTFCMECDADSFDGWDAIKHSDTCAYPKIMAALAAAPSEQPSVDCQKLVRHCADELERALGERDEMEERVNAIAVALRLTEEEMQWSNLNDVGERCVERAEILAREAREGLRERVAKAIWDHEIAESIRIKAFPERLAKDYAQWPEDSLRQPYCQRTYREADAVLAALAAPAPKPARANTLEYLGWLVSELELTANGIWGVRELRGDIQAVKERVQKLGVDLQSAAPKPALPAERDDTDLEGLLNTGADFPS